jgi:SP family arabinose:H+ symporter-like MFS transporter
MNQSTQQKNSSYLIFIALTAAFGGFLFGYDTAVISGTISLVKQQFALSTLMEGWFVSSALVGCILGVMMAGEMSDRFGRKASLIASGLLFCISAFGCALCGSHTELIIFRLVGGLGIGIASMLSPLYISEVSPAKIRGRMVALYQLAICLGIVAAYLTNAWLMKLSVSPGLFSDGGVLHKVFVVDVWRSMFGASAIPAIFFFLAMFFVPESPRWFAAKANHRKAEAILAKINGSLVARQELVSIKETLAKEEKGSWAVLFRPGIRIAMFAGITLALLSQFTGINAIIYYGPRIMEEAGLKLGDALGGQVIIGIVNAVTTGFAIWKIDQYGRKKLLNIGVTGMFFSLLAVGLLFLLKQTEGFLLIGSIITFITFFEIGFGPVIWVLLSEIYPTNIRGRAMSIATLMLWVGTAIIGQVVPWMLETLSPAVTFFVFALCCIPVSFILKLIPETKGLSLEDIENEWKIK